MIEDEITPKKAGDSWVYGLNWRKFLKLQPITNATITLCPSDVSGVTLGPTFTDINDNVYCEVSGGNVGTTANLEVRVWSDPKGPWTETLKISIVADDCDPFVGVAGSGSVALVMSGQGLGTSTSPGVVTGAGLSGLVISGRATGSFVANVAVGSSTLALSGASSGSFNVFHAPNLIAAINNVKAGTGNARLSLVGDSLTAGAHDASGGTSLWASSYPALLAPIMGTANSVSTNIQSVIGDAGIAFTGGSAATYTAYDPRVTFGTNWALGTTGAYSTVGGTPYRNPASSGALTVTFPNAWDTLEIGGYSFATGTSGVVASIDGGAGTTLNCSVGVTVVKTTISTTQSTHSLTLTPTASGIFLTHVMAYSVSNKQLSIVNMGWSGSSSADWNNTSFTYKPSLVFSLFTADCYGIMLGTNDTQQGLTVASFTTNMQAIITLLKNSTTDVFLMVPFPQSTTYNANTTQVRQDQFSAAIRTLATTNNIPCLDLVNGFGAWPGFGTWANANSNGYAYDGLHPNPAGYAVIAQQVSNFLAS